MTTPLSSDMIALRTHINIAICREIFPYEFDYAYERAPSALVTEYGVRDIIKFFPDYHVTVSHCKIPAKLGETGCTIRFVVYWSEKMTKRTTLKKDDLDILTERIDKLRLQINALWYAPEMPGYTIARQSFEELSRAENR
jgi:hypothetical protein